MLETKQPSLLWRVVLAPCTSAIRPLPRIGYDVPLWRAVLIRSSCPALQLWACRYWALLSRPWFSLDTTRALFVVTSRGLADALAGPAADQPRYVSDSTTVVIGSGANVKLSAAPAGEGHIPSNTNVCQPYGPGVALATKAPGGGETST